MSSSTLRGLGVAGQRLASPARTYTPIVGAQLDLLAGGGVHGGVQGGGVLGG